MPERTPPAALTPRELLLEMLTYCRPADTDTEKAFIDRFIRPLGTTSDGYGNLMLTVGPAPRILWSSHTDTVHTSEGRQLVMVRGDTASVALSKRAKRDKLPGNRNCLGADCTTGVWLMAEMIRAGVPGLYVFHRSEECGGKGSGYIAQHGRATLAGIEMAIAFDRKGCTSVITHQFGARTASDRFATDLASLLGDGFAPDDGGTFTDTENYAHCVPECTNVSVGYRGAHTPYERQDVAFAMRLRDAMLTADFSTLVAHRDPTAADTTGGWWDSYRDMDYPTTPIRKADHLGTASAALARFVFDYPETVADFLATNGFMLFDLEDHRDVLAALASTDRPAAFGRVADPEAEEGDGHRFD